MGERHIQALRYLRLNVGVHTQATCIENVIIKLGGLDLLREKEIPCIFPHTNDLDCLRFFLNIC